MGIRDFLNFKRLLKKDKKAWDAFVERFSGVIHASILKVFNSHTKDFNTQDVEEVVQDVFLRLLKDDCRLLKSYNPHRASLVTWLTIISRSATIDFLRRRKIATTSLDDLTELKIHPHFDSDICIPEGLLSERQKLVLQLFFDKNMQIKDIAGLLGVKVQTMRSCKHKAIKKLRKFFKSKG
ncbi:MAG: hypothetical protein GF375_00355 [Candidatus Omnitrophica bacterium]|nr:hypothetical protein [Candidatus Omnitrophota bacterium]MBD3268624.1 hypothetical protein [Candidatus Omnitrophota bacterium]